MARKEKDLFMEYKRMLIDAGIYHPKLDAQIRAAAITESMILDTYEEMNQKPKATYPPNVKGIPQEKESKLFAPLTKLLSVQINQLRVLGLNYDTTPSKMPEEATSKQATGLAAALSQRTRTFNKPNE